MFTIATRLSLGFFAGFLSHLVFQGAFGATLYALNLLPALPWSLMPVPPLGVPKSVSLAFWAGLWGVAYAVLERRFTAAHAWWLGGLVFGIALPLLVHWFVVLPLKGARIGGGFHRAMVPIEVGFHGIFGVGTAFIFRSGMTFIRQRGGVSPETVRG